LLAAAAVVVEGKTVRAAAALEVQTTEMPLLEPC
tara:strand:- start:214 stop:315 length:102 start_codon:yes stop_codon:yes gene_type:complete